MKKFKQLKKDVAFILKTQSRSAIRIHDLEKINKLKEAEANITEVVDSSIPVVIWTDHHMFDFAGFVIGKYTQGSLDDSISHNEMLIEYKTAKGFA